MIGVNAGWVVALMTNLKSVRNFSKVNLPRNAMRQVGYFGDGERAISFFEPMACPFPAFISGELVDSTPKTFAERYNELLLIMTLNKSAWFTLNHAHAFVIAFRNRGFLATAAMTIAVWDFVLSHKNASCRMAVSACV